LHLALLYWILLVTLHEGHLRQSCVGKLCAGGDLMAGLDGNHRRPPIPYPNDDPKRLPAGCGALCPAP